MDMTQLIPVTRAGKERSAEEELRGNAAQGPDVYGHLEIEFLLLLRDGGFEEAEEDLRCPGGVDITSRGKQRDKWVGGGRAQRGDEKS